MKLTLITLNLGHSGTHRATPGIIFPFFRFGRLLLDISEGIQVLLCDEGHGRVNVIDPNDLRVTAGRTENV